MIKIQLWSFLCNKIRSRGKLTYSAKKHVQTGKFKINLNILKSFFIFFTKRNVNVKYKLLFFRMAQKFTIDEEDEIFQCAICLENMLNGRPKALPCLHTFCADCIKNLISPLSNIVRCPICRKASEVIGGEENLPDNFYLKNLAKHETTVTNTDMQMTGSKIYSKDRKESYTSHT